MQLSQLLGESLLLFWRKAMRPKSGTAVPELRTQDLGDFKFPESMV